MRNVSEEPPKASSWKFFVALGILAILVIAFGAYQSWKRDQAVAKDQYNGFDFRQTADGFWVTQVQLGKQPYDIPFYHHPREVEDVVVRDHDADSLLTARNRTVQQVFISVDPDAGAKVAGIGGTDLARLIGTKYNFLNLPVTGALSRPANTTVDYPILSCEDATSEIVIIQFALDPAANAVVRDENCVILFYKNPDDAIRVADRYAYMLVGIMP